jgi:uncharacterized repeat protein (TIGR01451 family)
MNLKMRRLIVGGVGVMAVVWATRSGVAWTVRPCGEAVKATPGGSGEIQLPCGSSRTYNASSEIRFIEVDNPEVVEITGGGKKLTVNGLQEGSTKATIWYEASELPVQVLVRVMGSDSVVQTESEVRANSEIRQASASGTMPLTGSLSSLVSNYVQQLPAISLESSSPVTATLGKMVEQRIVVRNTGSVPAEQVEVRGNLSIDSELISTEPKADVVNSTLVWRFARIPAGGQETIVLRVKPLVAGELSCQTNVSFKSTASVKTQVQEAKLKLTCEAPTSVIVGSEVRLVMNVTNVGSAPAEGVRIRQLAPGVTQASDSNARPLMLEVGTLQPGESRSLETSSIAREPGLVRINLVAQSEDGLQATAEHTVRVTAPKLALQATGPDFRYLNRKAMFQFTLTNPGDATATNVNLMVGLPEGLEYIDASGEGVFNAEKRTVAWVIGSLASQQKREFTVNVIPKSEGQHLQRVVAWADGNLLTKTDKVMRVEGVTALVLEISDTEDPIEVGSETVYQIRVMNRGSKSAERVQVAATIPDGMTLLRVESSGRHRIQGQQIQFETIGLLGPQAATVIQVHVKGTAQGTQRFRAVMSCPSMSNAVITEESTEVYGDQ